MLRLVDVSRYQVERPDPLDLIKVKAAGYQIINVALTGGRGYVSGAWAGQYLSNANALGLGRSTYHWLDGRTSGASQAAANLTRLRSLFGTTLTGFGHFVDVEETGANGITPPTFSHVRDYVNAMQDGLGRHIGIYSGDWYWQPKGWQGRDLTPWLMGQPNTPLAGVEPGPEHVAWTSGWGGWETFAVLQWAVKPLPGTGDCSLAMLRDHGVWADLSGGDALMSRADPGNAQPEAWLGPEITAPTLLDELRSVARSIEEQAVPRDPTGDRMADLMKWATERGHDLTTAGPGLPLIPMKAGEVCAPTINTEQAEWKAFGGSSLGCVGDANHGTGYHRGANFVPSTDYSRRRDPNGSDGPYVNWNYACAGDFRHGGTAKLRDLGRIVLAELMAGKWTNIGEFIGQPWADRPVMYWSRWENKLREYTGSGHDIWFHISWYRSRVDQLTHIWKSAKAIQDGVTMALTNADVDVMLARDKIKNPRQRGDSTTNPETSWGFAIGDTWGQTLNIIDLLKAMKTQIDLLGTALKAAVTNADDGAAVLAALNARSDEIKAALKAAEDADVARDAANVAALMTELGVIRGEATDPVTADELFTALERVYGEAFHQAAARPTE